MIPRLLLAMVTLTAAVHSAAAQDTTTCAKPGKSLEVIPSSAGKPPYPPEAMVKGQTGASILTVSIGQDGTPTEVKIARSSGSAQLDGAGADEIKKDWRWQPPLEDCKPTTGQQVVIVNWHLGAPPPPGAGFNVGEKDYPPGAVDRREAGDTYLKVTLGDGGAVKDARVTYSSNFTDLDDQANVILKTTPALLAGKPAGSMIVRMRWGLPGVVRMEIIGTVIRGR